MWMFVSEGLPVFVFVCASACVYLSWSVFASVCLRVLVNFTYKVYSDYLFI